MIDLIIFKLGFLLLIYRILKKNIDGKNLGYSIIIFKIRLLK